jgi:hypothetical protein
MRVNNGSNTGIKDWGPGGGYHVLKNRGIIVFNSTGVDMFYPDNSSGEYNSVFNNVGNVSGVSVVKGDFIDAYGNLRKDQVGFGNYCWNGYPGEAAPVPAGCPSGYTSAGPYNTYGPMNNAGSYYYDRSTNWNASSTSTAYDIRSAGYTTDAIYWCAQMAREYYSICYGSFFYYWKTVRVCYR